MTGLNQLRDALTAITGRVHHYHAPAHETPPYIVWAEDGANVFSGDNHHAETATQGTIDLYSLDEGEPLHDGIQSALDGLPCCGWYLNSVQYEEDNGLIHWEWVFEV